MKRDVFKKPRALFLILLIVTIGGAGGMYVIREMMTAPHQITDLHVDSDAALKLGLMKQVSKKNGITEWELEAASATLAKDRNQAMLTQVEVVFYTENNEPVVLTSDQGILDTETHDMTFTGNVVVSHRSNTLKTDKLHYKKKPHIIFTQTKVWLDSPDAAMEADSMEIRINGNELVLQGNVKGTFSEHFILP